MGVGTTLSVASMQKSVRLPKAVSILPAERSNGYALSEETSNGNTNELIYIISSYAFSENLAYAAQRIA